MEWATKDSYFIKTGTIEEVEPLVKKFHYSHRLPGNIQVILIGCQAGGLFGDAGKNIAGIIFTIPPTRWSETVWELSRLVRVDCVNINLTQLISKAVKYLKQLNRIDLLVSFADATMNHHGGIYQAASWNYDGQRERAMDGVVINDKFYAGRSCNSRWGTRSPTKLSGLLKCEVLPHFDEGKHLYWLPLKHSGELKAAKLGLKRVAYPKPANSNS
jgi:hypothetical protein